MPLLSEKITTSVLFARVETDQGIAGYGLTRGSQRFGLREFINRELAPFLRDKNPLETERAWQQLYSTFNPHGQTGMWSSSVSAIDIALWDIKGKKYNEAVAQVSRLAPASRTFAKQVEQVVTSEAISVRMLPREQLCMQAAAG